MNIGLSALLGGTLLVTDLVLRPQFSEGFEEFVLFAIQGMASSYVYSAYQGSGMAVGCNADNEVEATGSDMSELLVVGIASGGIIAITDKFIKPQMFGSAGGSTIKFLVQGGILAYFISSAQARAMVRSGY